MKTASHKIAQELQESLEYIRRHTAQQPRTGLILGSGLGDFADTLQGSERIPTADIPHYPRSTVEGHKGYLVFGKVGKTPVLAVQGRTHYYEGHSIERVAYVVRLMALLGVDKLLVTNAAGGVNPRFRAGDLMVIEDQINFLFANPLIGAVVPPEPRFPDMFGVYHPPYVELIEQTALELKIPLRKGVLFVSSGPSYETAAEIKMIQRIGGDAVSMSTVPEVIVARARGIKVAGISCITNLATGLSSKPLSHEEVTEIAYQVKSQFQKLVREVILRMND
ncbi:MAG: purine-nucleoside phosphorylase [Calditrichaceae bacterium]|nr:purine-nucleoside phosphorylase [Calditrichia bacterium]NUQ42414.1 purine-nucleoside phosphorylase [Calditrichaceae bacterium]